MNWLRSVSIVCLVLIAVLAGGAASRIVIGLAELQAAATLALVLVLVVATVLVGAKRRRWRQNPYW